MSSVQDFFSDENKASQKGNPYFAANTIGDFCRGYFVKSRDQINQMKENKADDRKIYNRVYTLVVPQGEEYKAMSGGEEVAVKGGELIDVYGKMQIEEEGKLVQVISGFRNLTPGVMVGVKYVEDRPATQKGFRPTKIVSGFIDVRDVNMDAVKAHTFGGMVNPETGDAMKDEKAF